MHRRTALAGCALATTLAGASQGRPQKPANQSDLPLMSAELANSFSRPVFIATWAFGKAACERSRSVLETTGSILDAVEKGIHVAELDASNSSVGYGGLPNANGIVQLDAAFMDGE